MDEPKLSNNLESFWGWVEVLEFLEYPKNETGNYPEYVLRALTQFTDKPRTQEECKSLLDELTRLSEQEKTGKGDCKAEIISALEKDYYGVGDSL